MDANRTPSRCDAAPVAHGASTLATKDEGESLEPRRSLNPWCSCHVLCHRLPGAAPHGFHVVLVTILRSSTRHGTSLIRRQGLACSAPGVLVYAIFGACERWMAAVWVRHIEPSNSIALFLVIVFSLPRTPTGSSFVEDGKCRFSCFSPLRR